MSVDSESLNTVGLMTKLDKMGFPSEPLHIVMIALQIYRYGEFKSTVDQILLSYDPEKFEQTLGILSFNYLSKSPFLSDMQLPEIIPDWYINCHYFAFCILVTVVDSYYNSRFFPTELTYLKDTIEGKRPFLSWNTRLRDYSDLCTIIGWYMIWSLGLTVKDIDYILHHSERDKRSTPSFPYNLIESILIKHFI